MNGFRQLNEAGEVEVEFKITDKGLLEVTGPNGKDCRGSSKHPPKRVFRKIRCYNCGEFKNHVASKCVEPPQPKRCHNCRSDQHLVADFPTKTPTKQLQTGSDSEPITPSDCRLQAEDADGGSEQNQNDRFRFIFFAESRQIFKDVSHDENSVLVLSATKHFVLSSSCYDLKEAKPDLKGTNESIFVINLTSRAE